jgi:hypothetical protein
LIETKTNLDQTLREKEKQAHDLADLEGRLKENESELVVIRHSLGYKVMKSYARLFDRLLPEGSRRGELRKVATECARILTEEGIGNLSKKSLEKIRRREFRLAEPTRSKIMKEEVAKTSSISSTVASEFNDDVLKHELATV